MLVFDETNRQWADEVFQRIESKMEITVRRSTGIIPYRTENGRFENMAEKNICWWTNGFWEGLLWLLYDRTNKDLYRTAAEEGEEMLDGAFAQYSRLHHDVGFLWQLSAGLDYKITGNGQSRLRALYAATLLMSRFNLAGGYIRAWNDYPDENTSGWAIIDSMMNLSILYWASEELGDARFARVARAHANKTMEHHMRQDGSAKHIVIYDPESGEELGEDGGQGYSIGSSWSRGQAWALYGFLISYKHTGQREYLDISKRAANYFISNVWQDWLPRCDFRGPKEPVIYDASAGAIAACGLLELAKTLPREEGAVYQEAALCMLREMERHFCNWDPETDGILYYGSINYKEEEGRNRYLVYSDFFFTQAILTVLGSKLEIW